MDQIIVYPQRIGEVSYLSADRIEIDVLLRHEQLTERLVGQLREQKKIADATPEAFRIAVARRPAGAPWPPRGFTEAYLVEAGLIEPAAMPEPPEKPAAAPGQPPGPQPVLIDTVARTDEAIPVGKYFLQPKKRSNFVFYDAITAEGRLLRAKSFKTVDDGAAFLNGLSTEEQAADTSGQGDGEEAGDGGDIRSDTADGEGSDPSADR